MRESLGHCRAAGAIASGAALLFVTAFDAAPATAAEGGRVFAALKGRALVAVTDLDSGEQSAVVTSGPPIDLALTAGATHLVASRPGAVEVLDLLGGAPPRRVAMPGVRAVTVAADGSGVFASRGRPRGLSALPLSVDGGDLLWTVPLPRRVRILASNDRTRRVVSLDFGATGLMSILDAATGAVLSRVRAGQQPFDLALSADGGTAYVLNRRDGTISVISVPGAAVVATLPVGRRPSAMVLDGRRGQVVVALPGPSRIAAVDLATGAVRATAPLPARARDIVLTPDGTRLVVGTRGELRVFDAVSLQSRGVFVLSGAVRKLAVAPLSNGPPLPSVTATLPAAERTPTAATPATATPTATASHEAPTPAPAATATVPSVATPTVSAQPVIAYGDVFDDATAWPLGDVTVLAGGVERAKSDAHGRYALPALSAGEFVELRKDGYTRCIRRVDSSGPAARMRAARLTALAAATVIGRAGGEVQIPFANFLPASRRPWSPGVDPTIELAIPADALTAETGIRATAVGPQGVVAPLPLGWSVLIGIDLHVEFYAGQPAGATLRVPLVSLPPNASAAVAIAAWDDEARQWRGGPPTREVDDALEIAVSLRTGQIALLVADAPPASPPAAHAGALLDGVAQANAAAASALVLAEPPAVVGGTGMGALVLTTVQGSAPMPSGTVFAALLGETYDWRDGGRFAGPASRHDLAGYRVALGGGSMDSDAARLTALVAVMPRQEMPLTALAGGRIGIDVTLAGSDGVLGVVDGAGGEVSGPGVRLIVPPGATDGPIAIVLRPVQPDELPAGVAARADFAGAVALDPSGALGPQVTYGLWLGAAIPDGARFVVARTLATERGSALDVVAFAVGVGGLLAIDRCAGATLPCASGFGARGLYVVLGLTPNAALVTGSVRDATGARAGIVVRSDTVAVVNTTNASGQYVLPAPAGVASTLSARDVARDLKGQKTVVLPDALAPTVVTADIELEGTPPEVVQSVPPNHASGVAADTAIILTFSEPILGTSLTESSVVFERVADRRQPAGRSVPVAHRLSLIAGGAQLVLNPAEPLTADSTYRITLTSAVTDFSGHALAGSTASGHAGFETDFTTATAFPAAALPPNTLRMSLPDDQGRVFICGGPHLARPDSTVAIENEASIDVVTVVATGPTGESGSQQCDAFFSGRCETSQPGSFCAIIEAELGARIAVWVEDDLHNLVRLDAGSMRDEETGATAIGPAGGVVYAPPPGPDDAPYDAALYRALIPEGAFESVALVTVLPAFVDEFPHTADETMELVGGVRLDLGGAVPRAQLDISVPAPGDATAADQYLVAEVVNFRQREEMTAIDTAFWDQPAGLVTSDPGEFAGIRFDGLFAVLRARLCTAFATGYAAIGEQYDSAVIPGGMQLPFPLLGPERLRYVVPVPCNQSIVVELQKPSGEVVDTVATSVVPRQGEFVFVEEALSDDTTPPEVIPERVSVADEATDVAHDAQISIAFSETVLSASLDGNARVWCRIDGAEVEWQGTWSQSFDGRRIFFVPRAEHPLHGLPLGSECRVEIGAVEDRGRNALTVPFTRRFTTVAPAVVDHVEEVDALAVDTLGWHAFEGAHPELRQLVAFAEGDAYRLDSQGGIAITDVTERVAAAAPLLTLATAGYDYDVRFVAAQALTDGQGTTFTGPYLMSVDGARSDASPRRFGVWRLFDLSAMGALDVPQIVSRSVNQSAESYELLNSPAGNESPSTLALLRQIPNDVGLPLEVADLGVGLAFVANAPSIGLELIRVDGIDRRPERQGVTTALPGHFRSVATLGSWVIGARRDGLVATSAGLSRVRGAPDGPVDYALDGVTTVATLSAWPVDANADSVRHRNGHIEDDKRVDLVVAACRVEQRPALCTVGFDTETGAFRPDRLRGVIFLPEGSQPRRLLADRERRLLYVANGTVGLTIVDMQDPGGALDESPRDGVDDRVLASVALPAEGGRAAVAQDVAIDVNAVDPELSGHVLAYVAAQRDGWYTVDLGPARMRVALAGQVEAEGAWQTVEVEETRYFNEGRTTLYQPEVRLPAHLAELHPDSVTVRVETVDRSGAVIQPPGANFAPSSISLELLRVPETSRYTMARGQDGMFEEALVVSNLPLVESHDGGLHSLMRDTFPGLPFAAVYGGVGTSIRLTAEVMGDAMQGKSREVPIEKVQVILIGVDGMRQDVLYPPEENAVQEPGVNYYVDPHTLPGFAQLFGARLAKGAMDDGKATADELKGDLEAHHYRFPAVTSVFPSITLASWASILTGKLPRETGQLGNEFFARDITQSIPTQPPAGVDAQGLITFSDGAFWRSAGDNHALVPFRGDWRESPQNRTLRHSSEGVETIFEQIEPFLRASGYFTPEQAVSISVLQHYARGLDARGPDRWLTYPPDLGTLATFVLPALREGASARDESLALDVSSVAAANVYLQDHLMDGDRRNDVPFPAFFLLYLPGLDHDAHGTGHGPGGSRYTDYVRRYLDTVIQDFVLKLRSIGELYNKLFIITADHGHTSMGDVPADLARCGDLREELAPLSELTGRDDVLRERTENANLNSWELSTVFQQINERLLPGSPAFGFRVRLLVPPEVALAPENDDTASSSIAGLATVIPALNGPMAHFYIRSREAGDFSALPDVRRGDEPAEVAMFAEFLRIALSDSMEPTYLGLSQEDVDAIRKSTGKMMGSVDFILYRDPADRQYRVFESLAPDGTLISSTLSSIAAAGQDHLVDPVFRIEAMNDSARSGDVVVHFHFDSDSPVTDRFTSGVSCRAWHGGLGRADSFVPVLAGYPGGGRAEFAQWWDEARSGVCSDVGNLNCRGNWFATDLITRWLEDDYESRN